VIKLFNRLFGKKEEIKKSCTEAVWYYERKGHPMPPSAGVYRVGVENGNVNYAIYAAWNGKIWVGLDHSEDFQCWRYVLDKERDRQELLNRMDNDLGTTEIPYPPANPELNGAR